MAGPLDRAFVEIVPDFDRFPAAVRKGVAEAGKQIENNLTNSVSKAENAVAKEGEKLGKTLGDTISDSTGEALAEGFSRNAAGRLVDSKGKFVSLAKAMGQETGEEISKSIGDGLEKGFKRDVNGKLRDQFGRFVDDGGRGGRNTGLSFGGGFADGLNDALSTLSGVKLPVAAFGALGLALAASAASAIQFTAALAPAVGIVAALPSSIGVLAAGMTTLNVATAGVGDAFASALTDDAAAFSEAMEGLAPNVQLAAQALRDLDPELEALRNSVQDAFFEGFDAVLNQLAETLLGPVTAGMVSVAGSINGIITGLTNVATSAEGVTFVSQSFEIMAGILERLQEPLTLLFSALLSVGSAINEAFGEEAGAGLAGLITQFAAFLEQAAASGDAVGWVNDALVVFQQIGDILSPIAGILGSIGAAAQTTGGNILGAFGAAIQTFDDFLASAQGQEVLISIFEALNQVGAAFGTVLAGIAPALPPIIEGISGILSVVAPLIAPLSELVGSVLTALAPQLAITASVIQTIIGPLTTIVALLGGILVEAITAVMPLINILATLLGGALGVALEVVGAVLQAVAPIFTVLFEALQPIIEALGPLFELLGVVADIVGAVLAPVIQVLGDILLWLVENVILPIVVPIVENLISTLVDGLGVAINWLVEQFQLAGAGLELVWNFIRDTVVARAEEISNGFDALVGFFKAGWAVLNSAVFTPIKNGINTVKDVVSSALDGIESGWNGFISFVKGIPGKISGALSSMFSPLASGFKSAINSVIRGWNNLSFTLPAVDIPGVGTVGGATLNTPNIPYLASGALATGPTLAMVGEGRFNEAILPLGDPRVDSLLASALGRAGAQNSIVAGGAEATAAAASIGDMHFLVQIGDRELNDVIVERIDENNRTMLRRARAGTRRNG
jgi:phage-related protein